MNTNSKRLGIYTAIMMLMTAAATALRTIACINDLDHASGFFTDKTLITIANVIITVTVMGMFSYLFIAPRIKLIASFSTSATYVTTGVLGVATAFLGARVFSFVGEATKHAMVFDGKLTASGIAVAIGVPCAILAFISIAHHFFNAFITESKTDVRAYFAIATIAFLALYAMLIYVDSTLSLGESTKVTRLIAFLMAALFFLYEARISLGREMWRIYTSFGLGAAALCAYASIPSIITYFAEQKLVSSAGKSSLASLEEYILLLALFIFILARLIITMQLHEEEENSYIRTLKDYANEREKSVAESSARHSKTFASKQLSIFDLYGGEIAVDEEDDEEKVNDAPVIEEEKQCMISDDAIYESIFGKMPERDVETKEPEESNDAEPEDERAAEEIADEILNSLDNAINGASNDKKETEI